MTGIEQFRYDDKRVLVVGGATGMGAAAAKMAKELGAEVVVLDESFAALDPENMQRAVACVLKRAKSLLVIAHR